MDKMSEENVLFLRGNGNKSGDEDIWDDTALIQAYDKAVNLAKEQVAKRIAMDAPSQQKSQSSKHTNHVKKTLKKWTVGAPCRAVYSVDGQVYEAIVSKIHENSGMCIVKFVGYQNSEKVELSSLLESEGLQSQIAQQKDALAQKANETIDSDTSTYSSQQNSKQINGERMDYDMEDSRPFKNDFMPEPGYFTSTIDAMPPAPPLPPQLMAKLPETDADALSSMLMSWYISGFHTGYYHGLKQAKVNQQKRRNCQ